MENKRRITLADLDRLDGGSFDRMVQDISKTTSDKKEIEELTSLNILHNFSKRLKKDRKEESSSNVARKEVERKQDLEDKAVKQCLDRADHCIEGKHEGRGKDGRKQFCVANPAEEKLGRKIKIRKKNNDYDIDQPPNLPASIRELVARRGGTDVTPVIMKELSPSDLDTQQGCLFVPIGQVKEPNFLTEEESKDQRWSNQCDADSSMP